MNKILGHILILLMIPILNGNIVLTNDYETINYILYREKIDLDAKSLRGWLRVFNSNDKMRRYGIFVTDEERELIIIYLKQRSTEEQHKYNRTVK